MINRDRFLYKPIEIIPAHDLSFKHEGEGVIYHIRELANTTIEHVQVALFMKTQDRDGSIRFLTVTERMEPDTLEKDIRVLDRFSDDFKTSLIEYVFKTKNNFKLKSVSSFIDKVEDSDMEIKRYF